MHHYHLHNDRHYGCFYHSVCSQRREQDFCGVLHIQRDCQIILDFFLVAITASFNSFSTSAISAIVVVVASRNQIAHAAYRSQVIESVSPSSRTESM